MDKVLINAIATSCRVSIKLEVHYFVALRFVTKTVTAIPTTYVDSR